jgi:DNA-binding CsgD family transcriptional regulator
MTGLREPPDDITRPVIDRSEGVPLVVEELTATAIEEGIASARTVVPAAIRARVGERVRSLPREAQEVLSAAAVVGPGTVDLLTAVAHTSVDQAAAALAAAREQLLVTTPVADAAYAFPHVLVRDALVDLLGEHHRRELARSAAATLEAAGGADSFGARERAAALWETAGDPSRAAHALIDAGRRRFARHGVAGAIAVLERAVVLADDCGDNDSATVARQELCDIACFAGLADRAAAVSADVLARARSHGGLDTVAAAHLRCARAALVAADDVRAEAHLRSARAFATGGDVPLTVALDVVAATIRARRGGCVNGWRALVHAAEASYRRDVLFDALLAAASGSINDDLHRARRLLEQALDLATGEGLEPHRARALVELALVDHREAVGLRALRDAREVADAAGLVGDVARLDVAAAWVDLARGDHAAAAVAIDGARALCERHGLGLWRDVLAASGQLAAQTADRRRFESVCTELVDDRPAWRAVRRATEAMWTLMHDGAAAGYDHLGDPREVPLGTAVFDDSVTGLWCLVHELVAGGSGTNDPWRPARATSWTTGYDVLADAVRAGRAGDRDAAERLAATAWERFRSTPWNLNVARLLVANDAAAHGWGAAEQWLREALGTFDVHAHGPLASLCRAALRGIGAPVPRRGRGDLEVPPVLRAAGVTSREMDVLALVGQGLSNRAIARRLVLGERTVKSHVTSLLRKVGASTREELRRRTSPLLAGEDGVGVAVS